MRIHLALFLGLLATACHKEDASSLPTGEFMEHAEAPLKLFPIRTGFSDAEANWSKEAGGIQFALKRDNSEHDRGLDETIYLLIRNRATTPRPYLLPVGMDRPGGSWCMTIRTQTGKVIPQGSDSLIHCGVIEMLDPGNTAVYKFVIPRKLLAGADGSRVLVEVVYQDDERGTVNGEPFRITASIHVPLI